jgi:branched-chain amino acid aminotransferase
VIERTPTGPAVRDGVVVDALSLDLSWSDPAAQWGLGVFETVAVRASAPRDLNAHILRIAAAASRFNVAIPATDTLIGASRTVAAGVAGGYGWLRLNVSRSGRWAVYGGASEPSEEGRPVSAIVLPWRRHRLDPLVGVKSLAYAASVAGLEEAHRRGADEGLWLNDRGHVMDACTANVFVVRGRAAVTPSLADGARDGVTREHAIEALRALGLSVRQSKVRIATLTGADEIFLTSSLRGVRPIVRLDGRNVRSGNPGPVTRRVAERLAVDPAKGAVAHDEHSGGS